MELESLHKQQPVPMDMYSGVRLELRKKLKSSSLSQEDQDTLHLLSDAFGRMQVWWIGVMSSCDNPCWAWWFIVDIMLFITRKLRLWSGVLLRKSVQIFLSLDGWPDCQVSLSELRKIAANRGLIDSRLRSKIWPILLGIDIETFDWSEYSELAQMDHKDTPTVQADIPRSMNQFTKDLSPDEKEEKRSALKRLLNAVVNTHRGGRISCATRRHIAVDCWKLFSYST